MDIEMPLMDGFSVAERINKIVPSVPIVALSGSSRSGYSKRGRCYFQKAYTKTLQQSGTTLSNRIRIKSS